MLFSLPSPFFKYFYNHLTMTKWGRTSRFPSLNAWRGRSGPSAKDKSDVEPYPGQKSVWQKYLVSWDSSISVFISIPVPALSQQIFRTKKKKKKKSTIKANNKILVLKEFKLSWWADMSFRNNSKSKVLHVAGERMTMTVPWGYMQQGVGRDRSTRTRAEPHLRKQGRLWQRKARLSHESQGAWEWLGTQDLLKKKVAVSCFPTIPLNVCKLSNSWNFCSGEVSLHMWILQNWTMRSVLNRIKNKTLFLRLLFKFRANL